MLLCSVAFMSSALAQDAAKLETEYSFQCPANLSTRITLGEAGSETTGIASMDTHGRPVDPATLRFINSKVAGRSIERIESTCGGDFMDVVISLPQNEKIVATLQGTTLKVR